MDRGLVSVGITAVVLGALSVLVAVRGHLPRVVVLVIGFVIANGALMIARGMGWTER